MALFMMVEMALWHREGMSSVFGGSVSWSILEIWAGVWVVSVLGHVSGCCLWGVCVVEFLLG